MPRAGRLRRRAPEHPHARIGNRCRLGCSELRPVVHESPPQVEQVAPEVGGLGFVLDDMRERRFDDGARGVRLLRRPIPERASESVGGDVVRSIRRSSIRNAMLDSGAFAERPGNTNGLSPASDGTLQDLEAAGDSGTRCSRPALIRTAGIVHVRSPRRSRSTERQSLRWCERPSGSGTRMPAWSTSPASHAAHLCRNAGTCA